MLHADLNGILALIAVAMCWSFAVVLFRAALRGSVAHKLSLLLIVEGFALVTSGSIDQLFAAVDAFYLRHPWFTVVETGLHVLADCGMLALYPPFLAVALLTRLTRPFADRRLRIGIALTAGILYIALAWPSAAAVLNSTVDYRQLALPSAILNVALAALFAFGFVASLHAWHGSSGAARKRARIFTVSFGIRDVCWGVIYAMQVWGIWIGAYAMVFEETPPWFFLYPLGTCIAVPLIAYGILRTQLFDIDLRIRWTIKQSTLAAMIVAIVYFLSEGANRLLSNELGNWAGLIAAAVVVFFLVPLQKLAERVASAVMPNTHNTAEYTMFRKLQVYEAAMVEALPGGLSEKERVLLRRLQQSLGISADDAGAIEAELMRARAAA